VRFFTVIRIEAPPKPFRSTGGAWSTWCCRCRTPFIVELLPNEPTLAILCSRCWAEDA
jgi:hypothetical protein